jgi:hypothetical protein
MFYTQRGPSNQAFLFKSATKMGSQMVYELTEIDTCNRVAERIAPFTLFT